MSKNNSQVTDREELVTAVRTDLEEMITEVMLPQLKIMTKILTSPKVLHALAEVFIEIEIENEQSK